jgi:hypothetical protein
MDTSVRAGIEGTGNTDVPLVPHRKPLRTWAGHGTGATCHGCGESIQPHEIEYEIELPAAAGGQERMPPYQARHDGPSLRFHFACYRNWTAR